MASKLKTAHNPLPFPSPKSSWLRTNFITQINFSSGNPPIEPLTVEFKTLGACKLGISRYPDFNYNAQGGRGKGIATHTDSENMAVTFDLDTLYIPPLTSATTKFLGLPLPPFLKIDIVPELLQGIINRQSGKVELEFKAKFLFTAGNIYRAQPLFVATILTTDESAGKIRGGRGERMNKEGTCNLVGVATVDVIDDFLMNTFLSLPTECLASLNASICFIN
ncbi:unnamed protein product [Rhodiola kirilowii]